MSNEKRKTSWPHLPIGRSVHCLQSNKNLTITADTHRYSGSPGFGHGYSPSRLYQRGSRVENWHSIIHGKMAKHSINIVVHSPSQNFRYFRFFSTLFDLRICFRLSLRIWLSSIVNEATVVWSAIFSICLLWCRIFGRVFFRFAFSILFFALFEFLFLLSFLHKHNHRFGDFLATNILNRLHTDFCYFLLFFFFIFVVHSSGRAFVDK